MLEVLRGVTLAIATLTTGLQASLYYAFAVSVMPGLRRVDDGAFIEVMQQTTLRSSTRGSSSASSGHRC